MLPKFQYTLSL